MPSIKEQINNMENTIAVIMLQHENFERKMGEFVAELEVIKDRCIQYRKELGNLYKDIHGQDIDHSNV